MVKLIEERVRVAKSIIKDEEVEYEEKFYRCANCDEEENEFVSGKIENENLLNARNSYRKAHGLLTSDEIIAIRENYGLSRVDLARLLGWGEATISRYESKAIQDDAYDNMLRIIRDDPLSALELLQKNAKCFSDLKIFVIKQKIMEKLDGAGKEYLQRKALESEYVKYQEPCDENGYKVLDIDKLSLYTKAKDKSSTIIDEDKHKDDLIKKIKTLADKVRHISDSNRCINSELNEEWDDWYNSDEDEFFFIDDQGVLKDINNAIGLVHKKTS